MAREIKRDYIPTPELIKDGLKLAPVPVLSDDWIGLHRLLTDLRTVATDPRGTITGRTFRTAVEPDKRVEINTPDGIRIFNSDNELTVQFNGDALMLLGGTIVGGTFKTALSPNERIEIDSTNGIRVYNASNVLVGQIDEGAIFFSHVSTDLIEGIAHSTTSINLSGGSIALISNGTTVATLSANGLLLNTPTLAFGSYAATDAKLINVGTAIWVGKADGSGFGNLQAATITANSSFVGPLTGAVTGNLTGNVTGNLTGNVTGNLTGNVTGNLTGNVTGSVTGGTISATAMAVLNTAADSALELRANAARSRYVFATTGGTNRWLMRVANDDAEAGADAGSNFDLIAWSDAGAFIDIPLKIARATGGNITITRPIASSAAISCSTISAAGTSFGISVQYLDWASNPQTLNL